MADGGIERGAAKGAQDRVRTEYCLMEGKCGESWYFAWLYGIIEAMKEQTQETRITETITISRAEYEELKGQNEWLMEQLRLLKKKRFGASSEQTKEPLDGQMSLLFNEAEAYTAPPGPQKTT